MVLLGKMNVRIQKNETETCLIKTKINSKSIKRLETVKLPEENFKTFVLALYIKRDNQQCDKASFRMEEDTCKPLTNKRLTSMIYEWAKGLDINFSKEDI